MAIAAWEHAVSSGVVGPRPANSRHNLSPPTTPSRNRAPSIPLYTDGFSPLSAHNITPSPVTRPRDAAPIYVPLTSNQPTPICPIVHPAVQVAEFSVNGLLHLPSSSSSPSSGRSEGSSSLGSATRLASIISALEELDVESPEPSYVVLRGLSPGVYASRCVSAHLFFVSSLMIKFSKSALAATGSNPRGMCCLVASEDIANAMFVAKVMANEIEYL
jgi:hypothetical protein